MKGLAGGGDVWVRADGVLEVALPGGRPRRRTGGHAGVKVRDHLELVLLQRGGQRDDRLHQRKLVPDALVRAAAEGDVPIVGRLRTGRHTREQAGQRAGSLAMVSSRPGGCMRRDGPWSCGPFSPQGARDAAVIVKGTPTSGADAPKGIKGIKCLRSCLLLPYKHNRSAEG